MENTLYYTTEKPGNFVHPLTIKNTAVLVIDMQNEFVLKNYGDAKRVNADVKMSFFADLKMLFFTDKVYSVSLLLSLFCELKPDKSGPELSFFSIK